MENLILKRIHDRLSELNLSMSGASEKAGLGRETLRKAFERGNTPSIKTLTKLAPLLGTTPEWLLSGNSESAFTQQNNEVRAANVDGPSAMQMPKDVPVLGTAAGSHTHGAFQLEANEIDFVRRPPGLSSAKNVYALYVEGDSMAPMFKAGDLLFVHPDRPPRIGDSVVVQFKTAEHNYSEAVIGILCKRQSHCITLEKLNPANTIEIETRTIQAIHRILTMNDLFGI